MTTTKTVLTTQEVAARFDALAQQEKWFEIQEEFFAETIRSIDPLDSPYLGYAEGKANVRKKGEDFVKKIQAFHGAHTSSPVVGGNFFSVARSMEATIEGFGRIKMDQIMLYEVQNGKIVLEQFFY